LGYVGNVKHVGSLSGTNLVVGEECYKFGITSRGVSRSEEHKNNIDTYIMFYVAKCINSKELEDALKYELTKKKLIRHCCVGKQNYTELFTVSSTFGTKDVIKFIENWIGNYDTKFKSETLLLAEIDLKKEQLITEREKERALIEREKIILEQHKVKLRHAEVELGILKIKEMILKISKK
jgi:hypothetical protein